jgi:hypothetical protein
MTEPAHTPVLPGEADYARLARNVTDLLQELRVAQAAVQILFGFLLAVAFTEAFREGTQFEKVLHMTAVALTALSTAFLVAPAVWHRVVFQQGRRGELVRAGNFSALIGMAFLLAAVTVSVALIAKVTFGDAAMYAIGGSTGAIFFLVWFVVPMRLRRGPSQS